MAVKLIRGPGGEQPELPLMGHAKHEEGPRPNPDYAAYMRQYAYAAERLHRRALSWPYHPHAMAYWQALGRNWRW